jgi:hypothetical protein
VRFFNGQFLRQDEFREEQGYANHMRRRLNYALFTDGVVEITTDDLWIVQVTSGSATDKRIRIKRGMAIGANNDVFESREIILREDSAIIDLATSFAGGTVWVTVNYKRDPAVPVPLGSTTENSRFDETAELRFHATLAAARGATSDGDPFIIIGSVSFGSMNISRADRQIARLRSALLIPAPSISLSPPSVTAGGTVTLNINSPPGAFDLRPLAPANVGFNITAGMTLPVTIVGTPTETLAVVSFPLAAGATAGTRIMTVTIGGVGVSDDFVVNAFVPAPTLGTLNPDPPQRGNPLTINGTNFVAPTTVNFANAPNVAHTLVSSTVIQVAAVPFGAVAGTFSVTAAGGSANRAIGVVG